MERTRRPGRRRRACPNHWRRRQLPDCGSRTFASVKPEESALSDLTFTRREAVAALAATAALPLVSCRRAGTPATDADASKLLDSIGENLLRLSPGAATTLGIDTGARASLR